jgi:hypothetical protein
MLRSETSLRPADIARRDGVSRAHVSYRLKLLSLAPDIKSFLLGLRDARAIRFFGRMRLLRLTALPVAQQTREFENLRKQFVRQSKRAKGLSPQCRRKSA